jgi:hypothetical protein
MDLWMIIVLAVVLIALFAVVGGRSMFRGNQRDPKAPVSADTQRDFSDDPGTPRR